MTASVASGGITITATIARTESQRCIALLASASNPNAAAVTAGTNAQGTCPAAASQTGGSSTTHVLVLLQALHTKYGVQLTLTAVLSSVATTPVAQVYSAQPIVL